MGFIIIGFILAFCFMLLAIRLRMIAGEALGIALMICFLAIFAGLLIPTGGYKTPEEVQTIELQVLTSQTSSDENNVYYVLVTSNNEYLYSTLVESEFAGNGSKAYVSDSVPGEKVTVVEDESCENPRLTEYFHKAKITIWSFGFLKDKTSYVFYIPKGTIAYDISFKK